MASLALEQLSITLLKPIDLVVDPGECVSIMGESGSGKSLLLRAIADLDPNDGEARCGDQSRSAMAASKWRKTVALLPTETHWWFNTVSKHFNDSEPAYLQALGFPKEVMSWSIDRLSTGEKQRLGLLRLLDLQPQAILLDEPTSSLDPSNKDAIEEVILQYRQQMRAAVIWITHDKEQAQRVANRHFVIEGGYLKEKP